MADIYELHRKAFSDVSAYVVMREGNLVATVAFKYPRDGMGRLWAYVHAHGTPMVRGYASGCGYDKHSAAVHSAVSRVSEDTYEDTIADVRAIKGAVTDRGVRWDDELRAAGFSVHCAV